LQTKGKLIIRNFINIIKMIKSRRIKWAGNVARMKRMMGA
jgi:hypothetical protein